MKNIIKNNLHRKILLGTVLVIALVITGNFVLSKVFSNEIGDSDTVVDKEITTVQTKKISLETVTQDISVSAITEAFDETDIFPETNGKIFAFYYSEGEYIKKGQVLAKVEMDQSLSANFENAKTNLEIAEESQKNTKKLQKQLKKEAEGTDSEKSTEKTAELTNDIAKGQTKVAQGQVDFVQSQLDKYLIKAPISGFVSRINLDNGDLATIAMPIATISDNQKIKIEVALTEFDIDKVSVGQEAEINLSAYPDEKFIGKIYYVSSIADPVSKKFPVKIQLENIDKKIKSGVIAQTSIVVAKQENILVVPRKAIFLDDNLEKVYLINNDSKIKIVTIETEILGDKLKVVKGLTENDEIVVNGNYEFNEGEEVIVKN